MESLPDWLPPKPGDENGSVWAWALEQDDLKRPPLRQHKSGAKLDHSESRQQIANLGKGGQKGFK